MSPSTRSKAAGIALLANRGDAAGGEIMLLHLAGALRDLGRKVSIVAPRSPSETADLAAAAGFDVQRVPGGSRAAYLLGLRRWARRARGDLLWCNGLVPALALSGRSHRVVHLHQLPEGPVRIALDALARCGSAATVVPSAWMAARLPGSVALENWVPGPEGPAAEPQAERRREGGALRVGFLGRLTPDKGILDLLRAGELLERSRPGAFELLIAGDLRFVPEGQAEEIERALDAAGHRARRLGWAPRKELFRQIDMLVVPSDWPEVFGLVAAEAMAARVPLVVSDAGALPEVVGEDHPLVARAGDPESLAATIRRAAQLDRQELVEAQHRRWEQRWSPQAGRRRLQSFLTERGF